ncbi:SDR family oxidoreductase [Photobacterium japonica]|uniref:SDR family oxidoreductase n=1 Tax=Photobacterium japonica TaxID=2910235 RepID=UPI003D1128EB
METVVITGASRGIGLALIQQFLALGYRVIASYRGTPSAAQLALAAAKPLTLLALDVTDSAAVATFADGVTHALAGRPLDILINNAGVIGPDDQAFDTLDPQAWQQTFAVNTIAPLLVSRALLPLMDTAPRPRLVSISSQMSSLVGTGLGMYAYRSSKTALNKVMQVLSMEQKARGIIVCPIDPGWVKTDMGGDEADISVDVCAAGIIDVVQRLTIANTGQFLTWEGEERAW